MQLLASYESTFTYIYYHFNNNLILGHQSCQDIKILRYINRLIYNLKNYFPQQSKFQSVPAFSKNWLNFPS